MDFIDFTITRYICRHRHTHVDLLTKSSILILKPLPDDKILGLSKLKTFADDKLNVTQNIKVVFHRIENIVRKEEKC